MKEGKRVAAFSANPAPIAVRLDETQKALAAAQAAADAASKELAALQESANAKAAAIGAAQAALATAQKLAADTASPRRGSAGSR